MVTRYERLVDGRYRISAYERKVCLSEVIIVLDKSQLPSEYHIYRFSHSFIDFRYWLSCVMSLSFEQIKKFMKDDIDFSLMAELFR